MKIIKSIKRIRNFVKKTKKEGRLIGFVPTMGYLHEGHLSLIRKAERLTDVVVVSIFVNPTQFGRGEDYERYPRDLRRDKIEARKAGADVIFNPGVSEMYPVNYCTYVEVEKLTLPLCGANRPGHFRGVTTVVSKLLNIIQPNIAFFGQKDAQQAIVIKKMVRDLNWNIKIKILPIIREKSGLAMSSRNIYLSEKEKKEAAVLYKSLKKAKEMIISGERDPQKIIQAMKKTIKPINSKIDYISIVNIENLKEVKNISGRVLIALAVWMDKTRLIDNIIINTDRITKR